MVALYLAIAILSSGFCTIFYKYVSDACGNARTSALMTIFWFVPLGIVFGIIAVANGSFCVDAGTIWPAALGAVALFGCAFSLLESLKHNAFSVSVIIVNLSFVFPILLSLIFYPEQENTRLLQLIGMIVAIAVIVVTNLKKDKSESKASADARKIAIILAVVASLGNGTLDFAIKIQSYQGAPGSESSFYFYLYIFAAILAVIVFLLMGFGKQKFQILPEGKSKLWFSCLGLAACNGLCFLALGRAAGLINAAAEFTIVTTLAIVVSLVYGYIVMHNKFTVRDLISIIFCLVAIACQCFNV